MHIHGYVGVIYIYIYTYMYTYIWILNMYVYIQAIKNWIIPVIYFKQENFNYKLHVVIKDTFLSSDAVSLVREHCCVETNHQFDSKSEYMS